MRSARLKKITGAAVVAGIAALAAIPVLRPRCTEVHGNGLLAISVARLERGAARRFCYRDSAGERLRFLLARGSDGKVRAVFDACRQCYKFHQGYRIEHGYLICRLCGNRYPIDHMMKGEASCVPVALPHHDDEATVYVRVRDLESQNGLF
jgi:uncharacterized membrane protein